MLITVTFLASCSLVLLIFMVATGSNQRVEARVQNLSETTRTPVPTGTMTDFARFTLPKIARPLMPEDQDKRTLLKTRLVHAGFYGRHSMGLFLGVKMLLMVFPLLVGTTMGFAHMTPLLHGLGWGLAGSSLGMILPGFWVDRRKKKRQTVLRRALPDALDVVVICLEGGLSLQGGFQRVSSSLSSAHPLLSSELNITQREIQMGRSTGEALRQFGERCDLEEVRSLAAVVLQAERLGASIVKSLRVHAEALRIKRLQRAEELAHMAGTKMVFPTLLCIFPAIIFVVAGPAAFHIIEFFAQMK